MNATKPKGVIKMEKPKIGSWIDINGLQYKVIPAESCNECYLSYCNYQCKLLEGVYREKLTRCDGFAVIRRDAYIQQQNRMRKIGDGKLE